MQPAIEDFEPTAKLTWGPSGGNTAQHGTFVLATNPTPNSVNPSSSVGKYTKGAATFSVLTGTLPAGFKVDSLTPQLNLSVLAPAGAVGKTVSIQLVSATQGNISADALLDSAGAWTVLKYDMSKAIGVTDISTINILFDDGATGSNAGTMYFFDDLRLSKSTINACLGVTKLPFFLDDFECQRNVTYGGTPPLKVVKNPAPSSANQSSTVGQYTDPIADPYAALTIPYTTAIDLSKYNQLSMQVYGGPGGKVPMLFKLEGGTSPGKEIWDTLRVNNAWQTFKIDFSSVKAGNFKQISLFFNGGVTNPNADVYYIDNLQWQSEPITGCVTNFETPIKFIYFADDSLDGKQPRLLANPKKAGINTSATVLEFRRIPSGQTFQGAYTDLPAPAKWTTNKIILRAKVLMDHIGNVGFKLEGAPDGTNKELPISNTKVNEWEELTADFGAAGIKGTEGFTRITMFIDLGLPVATTTQVSYLDDIIVGEGGSCTSTGIFDPIKVEALSVFPNPASEVLVVRNAQNIRRLDVTNLLGQRVQTANVSNLNDDYNLSISGLAKGMYIISAYDETGKLTANSKFTKE